MFEPILTISVPAWVAIMFGLLFLVQAICSLYLVHIKRKIVALINTRDEEREACAKLCEEFTPKDDVDSGPEFAAAIRARNSG